MEIKLSSKLSIEVFHNSTINNPVKQYLISFNFDARFEVPVRKVWIFGLVKLEIMPRIILKQKSEHTKLELRSQIGNDDRK